jgi:hypothetical protein
MKYVSILTFLTILSYSCKSTSQQKKTIKRDIFELTISPEQKAVLVLFPCYPCDIENTKAEATFLHNIDQSKITLLLMNHNQKLYLTEEEKVLFAKQLNNILDENNVKKENIVIGGFSSGGNISLVLSNYLIKTKNPIQPTGVFIVDSPLDLEELYRSAKREVEKNINEEAVNEGKFLTDLFENNIGTPDENMEKYKSISPYLISQGSANNIAHLVNTKVRFYTEPDLEWQKKVKQREYEDLNAYKCEQTHKALLKLGSTKSELIVTQNRGFRANGQKHPHSWSIVERESLLKWILE